MSEDIERVILSKESEIAQLKAENDQMRDQIQRSYQKGCCLCKERIEELEGAIQKALLVGVSVDAFDDLREALEKGQDDE